MADDIDSSDCCELYTKIQKMKAIHNEASEGIYGGFAVNYTQRYKKWKQFTTFNLDEKPWVKLWTIHKDTKNESNSQQSRWALPQLSCCELYTKIQKMKAIHNIPIEFSPHLRLWTIHKDTKNESNSQPASCLSCPRLSCELYTKIQKMKAIHNKKVLHPLSCRAVNYTQRYKKWKQFTTHWTNMDNTIKLWTIHKDTKNESNSQHDGLKQTFVVGCELYTKIQKMKAIHNTLDYNLRTFGAVNYTQRYKKWKQFTTTDSRWIWAMKLWTIHKDTKNESNSQHTGQTWTTPSSCELYTKIQKMKAIHNPGVRIVGHNEAVNYTQRYKKWKQFTTYRFIWNFN